jgi:signal recognition particle GTPase
MFVMSIKQPTNGIFTLTKFLECLKAFDPKAMLPKAYSEDPYHRQQLKLMASETATHVGIVQLILDNESDLSISALRARVRQIANKAGVSVSEVSKLIKCYEKTRQLISVHRPQPPDPPSEVRASVPRLNEKRS